MSGYVHYSVLADRLILAQFDNDEHAIDVIAAEVGDCPHCWRFIAEHLAETAAERAENELGCDAAIADTEASIAESLDWLDKWAQQDGRS